MTLTAALRMPTYFISHGGGPWPWMPQMRAPYARLAQALASIPAELPRRPTAILMISAHWEAPAFTSQAHPRPPMLYDYHGFPPETYRVSYGSPGSPELAARVAQMIGSAGLPAAIDDRRGYDHGMFSPMQVMRPQADIPVLQLSLLDGLDPATHLRAGLALAPLREDNVLIIGSGLSYHNLRAFGSAGAVASREFGNWLDDVVTSEVGDRRAQALSHWSEAPFARSAHPREEHLLPLMVAVGAADGEAGQLSYREDAFLGALTISNYRFGPLPD